MEVEKNEREKKRNLGQSGFIDVADNTATNSAQDKFN
jgi:hypothetical protein